MLGLILLEFNAPDIPRRVVILYELFWSQAKYHRLSRANSRGYLSVAGKVRYKLD